MFLQRAFTLCFQDIILGFQIPILLVKLVVLMQFLLDLLVLPVDDTLEDLSAVLPPVSQIFLRSLESYCLRLELFLSLCSPLCYVHDEVDQVLKI